METSDLLDILSRGEDSQHQFKVDITNGKSLSAEIVAFANAEGGRIFIGVNDDNEVEALPDEDVRRINQLLSNTASQSVRPPVNPRTENVAVEGGVVMVVTVPEGVSKPYMDHDGHIWIKNGADKRRITAREEMQRMFQQANLVHADEVVVPGTSVADVDARSLRTYCDQLGGMDDLTNRQVLTNLNLMEDSGNLNAAGLLLFGQHPQRRLQTAVIKAVAFPGTEITDTHYLDSKDIDGPLTVMYEEALVFCLRNIRAQQGDQSVNSVGEPEIPKIVFEELLVNALLHRDYFVSSAIKLLIFTDRIEILSPGHLPNSLTIANIRVGTSNMRNPTLASHGSRLLPYRGLGSGIRRSLAAWPEIDFIDDRDRNEFTVIIKRQTEEA